MPVPVDPLHERLSQLCHRLATADDLRAGIEAAAWACDGMFSFYRAALVFPARQSERLYVAAAWARLPADELEGYDFSLRDHPLRGVIADAQPVVRTDPLQDAPDSALNRLYRHEGKLAELAVPLELGGRRGMLVFASRDSGGFDSRAVAWAGDVARILAVWARCWCGPDAPHALRAQYETLLESALDGIAVLEEGAIVYANESFREIFGLGPHGLMGRDFETLLLKDSRPALAEALTLLERRSRILPRLEVAAMGAGGCRLHLDLGLQNILYQGEPAALLQVHNATERAEREQEARTRYDDLDGLLNTLAHDMRVPLSTVLGFSELVLERRAEAAPEKLAEMIEVIRRSSLSLQELVEGLLDFSSLSRDQPFLETVATAQLIATVERELEGLILHTGAHLEYRQLPAALRGNRVQLARVFKNLMENGIKYCRTGQVPRVRVTCLGEDGPQYVLCVEDDGIGIEPERRGQVFELFHRGESGGAGVGLSIVERVVRSHGGRVWLECPAAGGSRFCFTLPKPGGEGRT